MTLQVAPPKMTTQTFGLRYEWEGIGINIDVRDLRMQNYELKGQITVTCDKVPGGDLLLQTNFNFSSSTTRKTTATRLNEGYESNWNAILEQLCYITIEHFRKGEPAIELTGDNCSVKPPEYVLEPFLIRNNPTILYGDWGAAKSTTSLLMAACCLLPWDDNPMGWRSPSDTYKTMYLDWETDKDTVFYTINSIATGSGLGALPIFYRRCKVPLAQDVEQIADWVASTGAGIIIVDSLTRAAGGDLTATEPANEFWDAVRAINKTFLILGHVAKAESDKNKRTVFGSQIYSTQARCLWEIKKSEEIGASQIDVTLYNRKSPSFTGLRQPIGMRIEFGDNSIYALSSQPEIPSEELEKIYTGDRIKDLLLKNGRMTAQGIADKLEIKTDTVYKALHRMAEKGFIVKLPGGFWGVKSYA